MMNKKIQCLPLTLLMLSAILVPVQGQEKDAAATKEGLQFFETKIRPVLAQNCYQCHSTEGQGVRGGLSVDSREGLRIGGESGAAVVPRNLNESLLWRAINYQDVQMPPKGRLSKTAIEDIRQWIMMGAPDPRVSKIEIIRTKVTPEDIAKGRQFWSFKKPVAPPVPIIPSTPSQPNWAKSEIDRFVHAKMIEHQLSPSEDADSETLLRRLHFDLIGLPPSVADINAFKSAWRLDSDKAISEEVDRLLALPQFGERWGRHWLDVARYAESAGKEVDLTFPNAWRYRDYVIDAFNTDKPYNQFVKEQIAGDLLPVKSDKDFAEHLIATGFLAIGTKALIERNPRQFNADLIDEQIDTTTRVILGVSVACARCHDHKFDPIPHTDYYAMAGIFASTDTFFGGSRTQRNRQPSDLIILPIHDPNPTDTPLSRSEVAELKKQRDELQADYVEARREQRKPPVADANGKMPAPALQAGPRLQLLERQIGELSNRINSVNEKGEPQTFCMGVQSKDIPHNARVLLRGEIDQPAQEVERGLVQVLSSKPVKIPAKSSGRLELAEWLASRDNPLTARVMVNRIWLHLIGEAIVREPENFGASGPKPTHPEMLDYLAIRFMDSGWSIKKMVREIATSRTYRLSSKYEKSRFEKDPENHYISHANARRLEGEVLRDAILAASGQIDLNRPRGSVIANVGSTMLGPNGLPVPMPGMQLAARGERGARGEPGGERGALPRGAQRAGAQRAGAMRAGALGAGAMAAGGPGGRRGGPGAGGIDANLAYRSVYLPIARNTLPHSLDVFDFAEPSMVIGQRETSNTPAQALFMLNNRLVLEQSDALTRRIFQEASSPADRAQLAFQLIYGRKATAEEIDASTEFYRKAEAAAPVTGPQRAAVAFSQFVQALFASAEFRYLN